MMINETVIIEHYCLIVSFCFDAYANVEISENSFQDSNFLCNILKDVKNFVMVLLNIF